MTILYSSAYLSDPFRPASSPHIEPVNTAARNAGQTATQYFSLTLGTGYSNVAPDKFQLMDFQDSTFTGGMAIRIKRLYFANSVNVGGSLTVNLGFLNTAPTVFGSALTTLQSATALDVAIATLLPVTLTQADTLGFTVASAGPSTTASTITGFVEWYFTRP